MYRLKYFCRVFSHISLIFPAIFFVAFLFTQSSVFAQTKVSFDFKLKLASKTSAGVFKRDGTLLRTLWNNVSYNAGIHHITWDGKDDEGRLLNDTGLVVKIVSNNVKYTWEGVIGNTSDSFTGSTVIRMFDRMHGMAIAGPVAYYGAGYTEGITSSYKLFTASPQKKYNLLYSDVQQMYQASEFVCTDSNYVYWAGYDPFDPKTSFVYATRVSDDKEVAFSSGSSVNITYGRTYSKAIDLTTGNLNAVPKGLAVQKKGIYLFVAHPKLNELHVLNKSTGALIQTLSFTTPRDLAIDKNDNLWMVSSANTVAKYTVNSNGTLSSATLSISGLIDPLALAVSPDNKTLVIIDGDSSQQLKAFDNNSGTSLWTFGQAGGYVNDPTVTNDKFYFSDTVTMLSKPFIAFQPDGSFWVGDVGNERVQHYTSSRVFIDRIMSLPHSYSVVADRNDPTRVFNEYLEFKVDYSKPLAPNNGSWTLVKNWRRGITKDYFMEGKVNIFSQVITLGNGRTYATLENCKVPDVRYPEVVELSSTGHVRYTGVRFDDFSKDMIGLDGSLRRFVSSGKVGDGGYWETQKLTGFKNNNPVWGSISNIGSIPTIEAKDPANGQISRPDMTSSDMLVVFERERYNTGYHLGAVKAGDNKYLWKTCPATTRDYEGPFPTDGAFDIGNRVEYAGGHVYALDRNILWNYHGEFWKNSQTNIWNHFYDNGLMIGQFGITAPEGERIQKEAFAMGAGNVFSSSLVKFGEDYYVYHNDESVHAGVHRWKISGLNTIQEQTITLPYSIKKSGGLNGFFFEGKDLNNFNLKTALLQPQINNVNTPPQISDINNFSARFTGFISSSVNGVYRFHVSNSKGMRLWIDGKLIINQWYNNSMNEFHSDSIVFEFDKLYTIKLEINGGRPMLLWSGKNLNKQIVPGVHFYPSDITMDENGIDLLEGLNSYDVLEDGLYGWTRNAVLEDSTNDDQYWHVKTNVKTYNREKPDLYMTFKRDNGLYKVNRELGLVNACIQNWKLSGVISFDGNYGTWDEQGGGTIDIIDDQGKIIARITHELIYDDAQLFPTQIKCNGEGIFNAYYKNISDIISQSQPFELIVSEAGIVFKYANFVAMGASLYDKDCHWNQPKTLQFSFKGGSNNYQRAYDFAALRFIAATTPQITISGTTSFCEGNMVTLTANKSYAYFWSNGLKTQSIQVFSSGVYSVNTSDENGCYSKSANTVIQVNSLPKPVIQSNGLQLISNITKGNQWYINGQPINGATQAVYQPTGNGEYTLIVTDSNQCSASATYNFQSGLEEKNSQNTVKIFPNPGNGLFQFQLGSDMNGHIEIYNLMGSLVLQAESPTEIDMRHYQKGVYVLYVNSNNKSQHFKLVID